MTYITRTYLLLILAILSLASCEKELDVTTVDVVLEDPTIIDGYLVSSTVVDGNDEYLYDAEVTFHSEENEYKTKTDAEGNFSIVIPSNVNEGFITIYKAPNYLTYLYFSPNHNLSPITKIRGLGDVISPSEIDLSNMWVLEGRIIFPDGTPHNNLSYSAERPNPVSGQWWNILLTENTTGEDGRFIIVGDSLSIQPEVSFGGIASTERCLKSFRVTHMVTEQSFDLGDIVYEPTIEGKAEVTFEVLGCQSELTAKAYFASQQPLGLFDEEVGPLSIPYCPDFGPKYAYVGVEDAQANNFDGNFFPTLEQSSNHTLEPCTPDGTFFEITIKGTTTYHEVKYDSQSEQFIFDDSNFNMYYEYDTFYSNCNTSSCGLKEFGFTWMTTFTYTDPTDTARSINLSTVFMDRVRDDEDIIAGIIMPLSTDEDFKIKFSIEKL